jgi:hypothetical protein
LSNRFKAGFCQGAGLAVAAGIAHVGIAVSGNWLASSALTVALVGTLLFALTEQVFRGLFVAHSSSAEWDTFKEAARFGTALAGCLAVYTVAGSLVGEARSFYCEPAVPWRIEIAVFGGFVSGLLLEMTRRRRLESALGPAVYLAIFWIGPFYGFFKAPMFLAQGLLIGCENHAVNGIITAAVGMLLAAYVGRFLATWLLRRPF